MNLKFKTIVQIFRKIMQLKAVNISKSLNEYNRNFFQKSSRKMALYPAMPSVFLYFLTQGIWSETEVLLLDRNHIEPEELQELPQLCNLVTMDLSHNNLYQLQPFLATCLGNLRDLIISGNSLEYLPQVISMSIAWLNYHMGNFQRI